MFTKIDVTVGREITKLINRFFFILSENYTIQCVL